MPLIYKNGDELIDLQSLNSEDLFNLIENIPDASDDEIEDSSDEDETIVASEAILDSYLERNSITELTIVVPHSEENLIQEPLTFTSVLNVEPSTSNKKSAVASKPKELQWKHKHIQNVPCTFSGNTELPDSIKNLETPFQFFKYFFDDNLLHKIIEESVKYSFSKNTGNQFNMSKNELLRYLGVCVMSSVSSLPNMRMYWNQIVGMDIIQNSISQKVFEKIRSNLHFNDNFINTNDKLHKLRPVIDVLSAKFLEIPMEEMLSIDEQICATKARHHLKQYLPLKPHKWGYKLFVLSGVSGFCYKFEIYSGTENDPEKRLSNEPDLGASSNVVVRLARDIPRDANYKLYFDNYYTSLPIIGYLAKNGIHSLGTVRRNRIPSCKVPTEADIKKLKRGASDEYVCDFEGTNICNVYWKDNKVVTLLSSFVGTEPIHAVNRYDRKKKERIQIPCPAIVKQYNRHMGGVDLLDSLIGRYKIKMRTRKWYMRLFYHLLDISIINAWLLHRRCNKDQQSMKLVDFRIELARTLLTIGTSTLAKRGRPSEVQREYDEKRKKPNVQPLPTKDVRLDGINHFPIWNETRLRCKNPSCKAQTFVICEKCGTALCFNKDKNCFKTFHTN